MVGIWGTDSAFADVIPEITIPENDQYKVAFFPQSIPIYLHKNISPRANVDVVRLRHNLEKQAGKNPYLRVLSHSEIETVFNHAELRQADSYMQAEIDMGYARNFMESMNYESAIELLRRAIDNYQKSYVQYYRPQNVAQAWQMLAYALIFQNEDVDSTDVDSADDDNAYDKLQPARLAFVELIRLAPHLIMLEGRQSPERVKLYDEALELFMSNALYRQTAQKDAAALSHKLNADILVMTRLVEDKTGEMFLEMDVYEAETAHMSYLSQKLDFSDHDQEGYVSDMAALMLSNVYDCLKVDTAEPEDALPSKSHRFALGGSGVYSSHMRHPTEQFLHNVGGNLSLAYMFNEHFFIRVEAEILAILQDSAHELYDAFEIYQFPVMVGISKDWRWIRAYIMLGLDFSFSSSYSISRSTICKTFGSDDIECDDSDVTTKGNQFALLLDFVVGVSFGKDPFYLTLDGVVSVTTRPTDSGYFKHMVGGRLGVQYWF